MHRTEPSRIQGLALQLADKVNTLVDQNEKIWEFKQAGWFGSNQLGMRMGYSGRASDAQNQSFRDYGSQRQANNRENRKSQFNRK
jgi:eukaryotic translation initiation factor 3 subunit C